jgi:type I restriction enzyme M protein
MTSELQPWPASTRHFYKPPEMRSLEEIKADLLALQEKGEDLLEDIFGGQKA